MRRQDPAAASADPGAAGPLGGRPSWLSWHPALAAVALVMALANAGYLTLVRYGSLAAALHAPAAALLAAVVCVVCFGAVYVAGSALMAWWSAGGRAPIRWRTSERGFFWLCFGILFAMWTIWICAHAPGLVRDDTVAQFMQSMGYAGYYTQHPLFTTLVFGAFWRLGAALGAPALGLFCYVLAQALITALCCAMVLVYLRRFGAPRALVIACVVFYACSRTMYQPVATMSKDALNGWLFLLVALMVVEMIRTRAAALERAGFLAAFTLVAFGCYASKRTMLYVVLPVLVLVALAAWRRWGRRRAAAAALAAVLPAALFVLVWTPVSQAVLHASETPGNELYSLPEQQVVGTLVAHPEALDARTRADLERFMDVDAACAAYNPARSDEIAACLRERPDALALLRTWLALGVRYPASYLEAFLHMAGPWFSFSTSISYGRDLARESLGEGRLELFARMFCGGDTERMAVLAAPFSTALPAPLAPLNQVCNRLDDLQLVWLVRPLGSPGLLCTGLPLVLAAWALERRAWRVLLMAGLSLMLIASFIAGPIALYWYTIPAVYVVPLVVAAPWIAHRSRPRAVAGRRA